MNNQQIENKDIEIANQIFENSTDASKGNTEMKNYTVPEEVIVKCMGTLAQE